ncbi:MAG: thioredoxin-disulfide reductase [Candidatus Altiarchaeota archaeon]
MDYDVVIIGGGPAGMTAGIYAIRRSLKTIIIERGLCGGQMQVTTEVCNWPGVKSVPGPELSAQMEDHCRSLGVEFLNDEVIDLALDGDVKTVKTRSKGIKCKTVVIATGGQHRKLQAKGEQKFVGKGVSYCATCDGPLFKGKSVAVIGGGNAAVEDALYLNGVADKTYLVHRRGELRAEETLQEDLKKSGVEVILDSAIEEISGDAFVSELRIKSNQSGEASSLKVNGIFISIGNVPSTQLAKKAGVQLDDKGFIQVGRDMRTNIPGVFAAGDVTGGIPQIATAVGEGCTAGLKAYMYIKNPYWGD